MQAAELAFAHGQFRHGSDQLRQHQPGLRRHRDRSRQARSRLRRHRRRRYRRDLRQPHRQCVAGLSRHRPNPQRRRRRTWVTETSRRHWPASRFFRSPSIPRDPEHCVAATTNGLYERVPAARWRFHSGSDAVRRAIRACDCRAIWRARRHWFAAEYGGLVFTSTDGITWSAIGTGFPAGIGRIALGVQRDNPNVLYAVGRQHLGRACRVCSGSTPWQVRGRTSPVRRTFCRSSTAAARATTIFASRSIPTTPTGFISAASYFDADPYPGVDLALRCHADGRGLHDGEHLDRRSTLMPTCIAWCTSRAIRTRCGPETTAASSST